MTIIGKKMLLALSLVSVTACAQQTEIREVRQEVGALNQQMQQLSQQTVKLTQQNALNADSTQGAYLLPGSKTPAQLKSLMGTLKLSLSNVRQGNNETLATLTISSSNTTAPLPAFTGKVESGQIQGTLENHQEVNVQSQGFTAPASVLMPSDVTIQLRFVGITPAQLGFVRIHDLQPSDPGYQPPPASPFQQN